MATHIWGNGMEFENPLVVTARQQGRLRDGDRRRRGHEALRSGAERRARSGQRAPEEHPLQRHRRAAQDRRGVQAAARSPSRTISCRCSRRAAARTGCIACNSFQVRGPFNAKGLSADAEPRAHLRLPPGRRGATADGAGRMRASRSSRRWRRRAYRRPVTAEDVNELFAYYQDGAKDGRLRGRRPQRRHRRAGQPVLPLSRRARARRAAPGDTYTISDLELASKLSFFLWNTIPGRRAAAAGRSTAS